MPALFEGLSERINVVMDRLDDRQRTIPPLAVVNGVFKKYEDDRGSQLAKLLAYNGFFSMFPLLLASVSVLGIVLKDNPKLRETLINSALSSIPVLGSNLQDTDPLSGGTSVLVISILMAFWAGLGLLDMLQEVVNTVWNVPRFKRPPWIPRRLRAAGGALVIVACAGISGLGSYVLTTSLADPWRSIIAALMALAAGAIAFLALHKILCARHLTLRELLPGAVATALGWWALFSLGSFYVDRVVKNASDTYGAFAVVLGLLSWSYLLGMMFVYSTEIPAVLADGLWPRSLTGRNLGEPDELAIEIAARRELKFKAAEVSVQVEDVPADDELDAESRLT